MFKLKSIKLITFILIFFEFYGSEISRIDQGKDSQQELNLLPKNLVIEAEVSSENLQETIKNSEEKIYKNAENILKTSKTEILVSPTLELPAIDGSLSENIPSEPILFDKNPESEHIFLVKKAEKKELKVDNSKTELTKTYKEQENVKSFLFASWIHIFILISSVFTILILVALIGFSVYYRFYLLQKKKVPFSAPLFLSCFFPRPVNYETEISVLCSKYMTEA